MYSSPTGLMEASRLSRLSGPWSAVLEYDTPDYNESKVCQWELISAWTAAAHCANPFDRVFVWVPKSGGIDHYIWASSWIRSGSLTRTGTRHIPSRWWRRP